jgi:DNA-binding NtrC family response regulator
MKRILIIDESEVIRETLALILGREFIVSKRTLGGKQFRFADANEAIDLLILGVAPQLRSEAVNLARLSAQLPCAVLFLVDSKSTARAFEDVDQIGCLSKPFSPYELHARVGELLARRRDLPRSPVPVSSESPNSLARFLEYPYVNRSVASLAQRFAATRLPILISGETGCGQDSVARAILSLLPNSRIRVFINVLELAADYLTQRSLQLSQCRVLDDAAPIVLIENLDKCDAAGQSRLFRFLEEHEEKCGPLQCLTTATGDLLERVYGGGFLAGLYYKLATLTLKLPPLRERAEDVPLIADWFARRYAAALQLVEPTLSSDAIERLRNYLWFGNLNELETVIARTLALRGGGDIDASDLVFDFGGDPVVGVKPFEPAHSAAPPTKSLSQPKLAVYNGDSFANGSADGRGKPIELSVVIHELAHELKNPMVTIKTFAQLLGDRYQDENFRARFQEIVGDDIERMDDLLEVMIEFADFAQPKPINVPLGEKLREVANDIQSEMNKRQSRFEWKSNGADYKVRTDESQLTFILRNVLLTVLSHAKLGSEIAVDFAEKGSMTIAYLREGARVASITHYLTDASAQPNGGILPLRILLSQQLVERNGGRFAMDQSDPEKDIFRLEFPIG